MKRSEKILWTALIIVSSVLLSRLLQPFFDDTNTAMVYVLAVVASAFLLGFWPAITTCLLGVVLYDFVNLPPYFTLTSHVLDYLFTLVVMLVTAVAISTLSDRLRRQLLETERRAMRTAALFALSEDLAGDRDTEEILDITRGHMSRAFPVAVTAGLLPPGPQAGGQPGSVAFDRDPDGSLRVTLAAHREGERAAWIHLVPVNGWQPGTDEDAHLRAMVRLAEQALARTALREDVQQSLSRAQQEALRSSILGAVSHDLRTPLASIIGASSTLLDSGVELVDDARHELRRVIYEEALHMQRMVENLLDLARIRSGDIRSGMSWQAFEEIVGGTMAAIRRRSWNHEFLVEVPPDLPLVHCDGVLIERVLTNVLDNAAKYSPTGSRVTLRAHFEQRQLVVRVCDQGAGIPAELRARVFEPFFRSGGKPGSGLGLAICRGIVEAHDGTITVGDAPGGGCEVTINLPVPEGGPSFERELMARAVP